MWNDLSRYKLIYGDSKTIIGVRHKKFLHKIYVFTDRFTDTCNYGVALLIKTNINCKDYRLD